VVRVVDTRMVVEDHGPGLPVLPGGGFMSARVTLEDALEALNARKTSASAGRDFDLHGDDVTRLVFSGLDLNFDDLNEMGEAAAMHFIMCAVSNPEEPINTAVASAWIDGVVTGIIFERLRTTGRVS
jgi:hypothetical protein